MLHANQQNVSGFSSGVSLAKAEVLTIGHSTLDYESFLALLRQAKVTAIADVRSSPYSRNESFGRETLKAQLASEGISYVFLGVVLRWSSHKSRVLLRRYR